MIVAVDSVAAVKAADTADLSVILNNAGMEGIFFWTAGDFTGQADDTNVIESVDVSIASGAWVRQATNAVAHDLAAPGARARPARAKLAEWVSVTDFGAKGDADRSGGGTDDTAAIQAAIDASNNVYFPGSREGRLYKFSNLVLKTRTRLHGDGPRASVLRQIPTAMGYALRVVEDLGGAPPAAPVSDISEGGFGFRDIGIEASPRAGTTIGIGPGSRASMLTTENLRIANQHAETLGKAPYSIPPGTVAIAFDGGVGPKTGSVFVGNHRNLEIRSFEIAVWARNGVNEQKFSSCWIIDCRRAFDLNEISTWSVEASIETGVEDARGFVLTGEVSNLHIRGGRYEMYEPGGYLFEIGEAATLANVVVSLPPNLLITGDSGNPFLPGRKVAGTWPKGLYIEGFETAADSRFGRRIVAGSTTNNANGSEYQFAVRQLMLGGQNAGDGRFVIGDHAGTADAVIQNDGNHLDISHPHGVRFPNSGGASGHQQPVWMGGHALWVDGSGKLRIKSGSPNGDTDGTIVGTQS